MTVTTKDIERLRKMINEPLTTTYSDVALGEVIARYPLMDERGEEPGLYVGSGAGSPAWVPNLVWIPGYDLNAAAAEIWDDKAALVAGNFDFSADGGKFEKKQVYDNYREQAKYYRMRRAPKSVRVFPQKDTTATEERFPWIGNLAEED